MSALAGFHHVKLPEAMSNAAAPGISACSILFRISISSKTVC
jgi:hypothetical protein